MNLFKDIKNLMLGTRITGKHLGRHAITIQYPEERWEMPERSRGIVVLLSDKETGELNCTGCLLCMKACPTAAILVDAPRGEDKKRKLKTFIVDHSLCCFCGLCEEACNFSALKMATKYEFSTLCKDDLIWDMNKLQEVGRDVDYVDTRRKKPARKEAAALPESSANGASETCVKRQSQTEPEGVKSGNPDETTAKADNDGPGEGQSVE